MSAEPCDVVDDAARKQLHDMRAPLITMRGFGDELASAVARLAALVDEHQDALPDAYCTASREVLDRDVRPCLNYLQSSVEKLADVLDSVSADRSGSVGE